ncbi:hypothetical protein MKX08_006058 [Trichoderma sp. CBMAI-0020]|nr:hypothetical protein MKX08_006058 [Trichoderma sp. CBMAI-0020]
MDGYRSPWNSDQVFVASDEDSDLSLPFKASLSGSEGNHASSEQDFGPVTSLHLSGRIISVTFTIPYRLQARKGGDNWRVDACNRHDHSVQFDVLNHLSSPCSPWDHTIVGWTGEVEFSRTAGNDTDTLGLESTTEVVEYYEVSGSDEDTISVGSITEQVEYSETCGSDHSLPPQNKPEDEGLLAALSEFSADGILLRRQTRWRRLVDNVLCPFFLGDKPLAADLESEEIWRDYYFMMECFFDKIHEIYTPGDVIMVHDYHLMMLPRLLRRRLPDAHVTFSMHTPCRHILEMSGRLEEFIEGILGSNIITFLEPGDTVDFKSWCAQKSSDRPSYWTTRAMDSCNSVPTGIDVSGILSFAQSEAVSERCETLRRAFKNRALVFSYGTPSSRMEMREVSSGYSRLLEHTTWWRESAVFLQVICTSRAEYALEEYSIFNDLIGLSENAYPIWSIWCEGCLSELDFHALVRCSDAAIFSFAPGGPMTAALEYFVCQPTGNKRPIVSDSNPIAHQVPGVIPYRRGDFNSIAGAIDYTLRLPGGLWTGIPRTPRLEDYDVSSFTTAEWWTKSVLRDLMEKLLRGCRPAGTSDSDMRSRSPEEFAGA